MIKINLLGEKVDYSTAIAVHVLVACLGLFGAFGVTFYLYDDVSSQLASAEDEHDRLARELEILKKKTKKVETLEEDKRLLKEKLVTIATLKAKKRGPVKVLDSVNIALPDGLWLEQIREREGFLELYGMAFDNQTIAVFMGALEQLDYFGDVYLVHSRHVVQEEVPLKEFMLRAEVEIRVLNKKEDEDQEGAEKVKKDKEATPA